MEAKQRLNRIFKRAPTLFKEHFQNMEKVNPNQAHVYFGDHSFFVLGSGGSGKTNLIYHHLAGRFLDGEKLKVFVLSGQERPEYQLLAKALDGQYACEETPYAFSELTEALYAEVEDQKEKIRAGGSYFRCEYNEAHENNPLPKLVLVISEVNHDNCCWDMVKLLKRSGLVQLIIDCREPMGDMRTPDSILSHIHKRIFLGPIRPQTKTVFELDDHFRNFQELLEAKTFEGAMMFYEVEYRTLLPYPSLYKAPDVKYQEFMKLFKGEE